MSMEYDEKKRLEEVKEQLRRERAAELHELRSASTRERDDARIAAKENQLQIQKQQLMEIEAMKHELQPEQLDNLYFDYERRLRVDHFYDEQKRDSDLDRQKEVMSHELECELIREKFQLKLRQKYGDKGLSDQEMKSLADEIISSAGNDDE